MGSAAANKRIGLVYAPSFATRLADKGLTSHNVGAELALGGGDLRYHLTAAFSRASISFSTLGTLHVPYSGLRLEPATFGIAIPVVKRPGLRLEVEPTLMALSGSVLVRGGEGVFLFSTGGDVRANVALGKLFLSASPLGFEVLFATVSDGFLQVGAAFHYRTRVSAGIEF